MVSFAPTSLVPSIYAVLALVAAEAAIRYAPAQGVAVSVALVAGLAGAMALRSVREDAEGFGLGLFLFWGALITGLGLAVGVAVREVYRQRGSLLLASEPPAVELSLEDLEELTPREREVLLLITRGYSNQQIAKALVIQTKTVKNHINRIYGKLELNSRYEAISRLLTSR